MKRIFCTSFAGTAALLLLLLSCGNSEGAAGVTETQETVPVQETTEAVTETRYVPNLPEADFAGAEFHVLGLSPDIVNGLLLEFDADASTGDTVDYALYQRNRKVEETFNVRFVSEYVHGVMDTVPIVKQSAMADDSSYQLVMLICREAFPAVLNGYAVPFDRIPHLDISQPWYMKHINDMMSVSGEYVLAYSDECMNAYMEAACLFFNKQMITDNDMENPFELVRTGKWTLDTFYKMANDAVRDVDGNGAFDENDIWGVCGEHDSFYPSVWIGADELLVEKIADGAPVYLAPGNEHLTAILEELAANLSRDGFFMNSFKQYPGIGETARNLGRQFFAQNGALFSATYVGGIVDLRNMEFDFGVIPLPKYDENQEGYFSRMMDGWIHVVPNTSQDMEMVGTVMESLAAETRNYVIPAYFDVALTDKYTRDTDSEEMLNILFDNIIVDLGDTVWYSTVRQPLTDEISRLKSEYVSILTKYENKINKELAKVTESLAALKSGT